MNRFLSDNFNIFVTEDNFYKFGLYKMMLIDAEKVVLIACYIL